MPSLTDEFVEGVLNSVDVCEVFLVERGGVGVVGVGSETVRTFGDLSVAGALEERLEGVGRALDGGDFTVFDDTEVDDATVGGRDL